MASARITEVQYNELLDAYRLKPGNASNAARAAGCDVRTARRAWALGWDSPEWARSIEQALEEEKVAARAQIEEADVAKAQEAARLRAEREKARESSVQQHKQEGVLASAAMANAGSLLQMSHYLSAMAIPLAQAMLDEWRFRLEEKKAGGKARFSDIEVLSVMKVLHRITWIGQTVGFTAKAAMEKLRLHVGKPTTIAEIRDGDVDEDAAILAMGSREELQGAVVDLLEGKMTPRAQKLLESQLPS